MDRGTSSSSSSSSPAVAVSNYQLVEVNQQPNTEPAMMGRDHNGDHPEMQIILLPQVAEAANESKFLDGREFGLPEGWIVELRPRTSPKYLGRIDRFFYQPGRTKRFRSLNAAQKCAMEMQATEVEQALMALSTAHQVPQSSGLQIDQQFRFKITNMEQAPVGLEGGSSNKTPLSVDPEIRKQIHSLRDAKRFARMKGKIGQALEPLQGGSSSKAALDVDPEIRKQIRSLRDAKRFARMKGKIEQAPGVLQGGSSTKELESSELSLSSRTRYTKAPRFDLANPLYGHTMVNKQP